MVFRLQTEKSSRDGGGGEDGGTDGKMKGKGGGKVEGVLEEMEKS